MELRATSVGPMDNNAYLLVDSGQGLLVDAAADPLALLALIGDTPVAAIVTTHRHLDHLGALADVARHTGARLVAGVPDADAIESAAGVRIDDRVWTTDTVHVGTLTLEVVGLVGHTPGSIALVVHQPGQPVQVFTGDSLFPGGLGRTWSSDDFATLYADVTTRLFDRFADDTVVWPGHGQPTTPGVERPHLPLWRARGW